LSRTGKQKPIARIQELLQTIADDLRKHPPHENRGRAGKRLLWYWQIGQAANRYLEASERYGRQVIDRLAEEVGKGTNWIRAYQRPGILHGVR